MTKKKVPPTRWQFDDATGMTVVEEPPPCPPPLPKPPPRKYRQAKDKQ